MSATTTTAPPKPPPTGPPPKPNGVTAQQRQQTRKNVNAGNPNVKVEPTAPPDPVTMYESVRNRIAALEEAEVTGEEEERRHAEEARASVRGAPDSVIQTKYIELFQEMKRLEREHAKERQKLTKDKDAAKTQYNKLSQAKTKVESLARELQKENRKLREDTRGLTLSFEKARDEINQVKDELVQRQLARPPFFARKPLQENGAQQPADIVVKVVCKFRAELFFKISRKTKLTRLFTAWESRMEVSPEPHGKKQSRKSANFIFTHAGRTVDWDQTPDEAGIENNDVIMAVELMDLTLADSEENPPKKPLLKKFPLEEDEAERAVEEMYDAVVRERLKDVLRRYELREKHFEAVVRSKELEVLLARARVEEQKGCVEAARRVARAAEQQNAALQAELEDMQLQEAVVAGKIQQCLQALGKSSLTDPSPAAARIVRDVLREHLEMRARTIEQNANQNSGDDAS
ncbi:hypothetical protein RhiJN_08452 [Ceratobasidium sp. AG-Ba]|nr:hypothetical protein RhiJN_08452 [Ceratobasidium sp. AG-Ba]QRW09237.1 hypothetical protein RhiLY_08236 [Ceratobasidium sp. AG-Ba]